MGKKMSLADLGTMMGMESSKSPFQFTAAKFLNDSWSTREFHSADSLVDYIYEIKNKPFDERIDILHVIVKDEKHVYLDYNHHTTMGERPMEEVLLMFDEPDVYKTLQYIQGTKTSKRRVTVPDTRFGAKASDGYTREVLQDETVHYKIPFEEVANYESKFDRILGSATERSSFGFSKPDYDNIRITDWNDKVLYTFEELKADKFATDRIGFNRMKFPEFETVAEQEAVCSYIHKVFSDATQWARENWRGVRENERIMTPYCFRYNGHLFIQAIRHGSDEKLNRAIDSRIEYRLKQNLSRNFPKCAKWHLGIWGSMALGGLYTEKIRPTTLDTYRIENSCYRFSISKDAVEKALGGAS